MNMKKVLRNLPAIFIAFVFIQSLFFKFTGSYETDHIFGTIADWSGIALFGVYGGYVIGIAELIASVLLFTPLRGLGALMTVGIMSGAIFFHLFTPLTVIIPEFNSAGEIVGDDGGLLFGMACIVWLCGLYLTFVDLKSENGFLNKFLKKAN